MLEAEVQAMVEERLRNRWGIAVAAVIMQICLGAVYGWSVFKNPLMRLEHWPETQVQLNFTLAIFFLGVGTVIGVDNVVRDGAVADESNDEPNVAGTRRTLQAMADEPRVTTTVIQTVGTKGYDGFALALVVA